MLKTNIDRKRQHSAIGKLVEMCRTSPVVTVARQGITAEVRRDRDAQTLYLDAMQLGCGSYNGAYVRAALDNGAQLATLDKKLIPHLVANGVRRWV